MSHVHFYDGNTLVLTVPNYFTADARVALSSAVDELPSRLSHVPGRTLKIEATSSESPSPVVSWTEY